MTAAKKAPSLKFRYDLVAVVWEDAHSSAAWMEASEVKLEPCIATTVGFLIMEDDDRILVADSLVDMEQMHTISGVTTIPRGMVRSITTIKKKGKGGN